MFRHKVTIEKITFLHTVNQLKGESIQNMCVCVWVWVCPIFNSKNLLIEMKYVCEENHKPLLQDIKEDMKK